MGKAIIISLFIFLCLLVGGIYLYFYYEKPAEQQALAQYVDINLYATYNGNKVKTGYIVEGSFNQKGETLDDGIIQMKVPINSTLKIYNYNLENQEYYTNLLTLYVLNSAPQRIELKLEHAGNLSVNINGTFGIDNNLTISLNSTGLYKNIHMCAKWSIDIITIKVPFTEYSTSNLGRYDRCYDLSKSLNSTESYSFNLEYKYFNQITKQDYINLTFYDLDYIQGLYVNSINNTDIGGKNINAYINNI